MYSIKFKHHTGDTNKILGKSKLHKNSKWIQMEIHLPILPYDDSDPDGKNHERP